jgi:hypothetical protein
MYGEVREKELQRKGDLPDVRIGVKQQESLVCTVLNTSAVSGSEGLEVHGRETR